MPICEMDVVTRSGKSFQLGYVTFDLKVKKNKPKKISNLKYFLGREFDKKKDADLLIKCPECWMPFVKIFDLYGYKKPAISCIINIHRQISCVKPQDLWVNASSCKIGGRMRKMNKISEKFNPRKMQKK